VKGDLIIEKSVRIDEGALFVESCLKAWNAEVDKELNVEGWLNADRVRVGGKREQVYRCSRIHSTSMDMWRLRR